MGYQSGRGGDVLAVRAFPLNLSRVAAVGANVDPVSVMGWGVMGSFRSGSLCFTRTLLQPNRGNLGDAGDFAEVAIDIPKGHIVLIPRV